MTHPSPPGQTAAPRLTWADVAKGACIVLVVLHHTTTKHVEGLVPEGLESVAAGWDAVTSLLKPVRMPLFFLLSGFFAASSLQRPWGLVLRRRVATPYYVYVWWLLIHAVVFSVAVSLPMNRTRDVGELLQDLLYASTGLWYLYALALYFVVVKALGRVDPRLVVGGAALLSLSASALPLDEVNRVSVLQYFVFFAAGALYPRVVRRLGELEGRHLPALLLAGYAVTWAGLTWAGAASSVRTLVLSLTAIPLAVMVSKATARVSPMSGLLAHLGRNTLPVYVLHVPALAVLHALVPAPQEPTPGNALLLLGYPVVATAVIVATTLGVHRLLVLAGLGFLFEIPRRPVRTEGPELTGAPVRR